MTRVGRAWYQENMKIYTKILIGMVVGVIIGITVGPTSSLLPHDEYTLGNASTAVFRLDPDKPETTIVFPSRTLEGRSTGPEVSAMVAGEVKEGTWNSDNTLRIDWVPVRIEITQNVAMYDTTGEFRKTLDKKVGDHLDAWLQIRNVTLEEGAVISTPTPLSSIGNTVNTMLNPIGAIFMKLIKMVIVPLVFASLLVGIASLGDVRKLGRMGGKTLGLYLMTTAIAVSIGLGCANLLNPGAYMAAEDKAKLEAQFTSSAGQKTDAAAEAPSALDNVLDVIPENPVASLSSGNMLQIIFFAVLFGVALTMLGAGEATVVVTFFDKVQEAMVVIIHIVMKLAPYGVAALVAEVIGTSGVSVLKALLVYSLTVLLGLSIHAVLVYGSIVTYLGKLKLFPFLKSIRPAQLLAFSTSSSSATLPVSMECAEENLGVSKAVSSFVLPLGSTVNMDGTALYQGVAAVFIAQVFGIDLSWGAQLGIVLTATMASIGAAGVPGAGMVTLAMVLTATGIPAVGLALILGMDRLLDMFRTAVNVTGDLSVTAAIARTEGESLKILTSDQDAADPKSGFEGRVPDETEAVVPE